jgi:hypothetical protein
MPYRFMLLEPSSQALNYSHSLLFAVLAYKALVSGNTCH